MAGSVTHSTLDYLAHRLDELADDFPTTASVGVDLVALTDHIGVLAHHLDYATERAQERLTATETVYLPERQAIERLAQAAAGITGALNVLAEALAHAASGYRKEAIPGIESTHLRNDAATVRLLVVERYAEARARLTDTATALRPTAQPASGCVPRSTALPVQQPAPLRTGEPARPTRR